MSKEMLVFILNYCSYATEKDKTNKMIKLEQLTVYLAHNQEEIANNLTCLIESFS